MNNLMRSHWCPPPLAPRIEPGMLDIWLFSLDVAPHLAALFSGTLSADERERASRYISEERSLEYRVCRGMLRSILARYLHAAPSGIMFRYDPWGKPAVAFPERNGIAFNLSHSGRLALLAIARDNSPGVDIERISPDICCSEIAAGEFTTREQRLFFRARDEEQRNLFFSFWTRKEAVLKGIGKGLSIEPSEVDVADPDSGPVWETSFTPHGTWHLRDIAADPGYAAACAYQDGIEDIRFFALGLKHGFMN